jgi:hypothetical protein
VIDISINPRRRLAALALGLGLAVAAQAAPASADGAETHHYRFKGRTAEARLYTSDGCVGREVFVHAVDGQVKAEPGRPDAQTTVFVAVTRFDICTQQPLGFSLGFREDVGDALQIDRLDGASLATTVQMTDMATATTYPMDVQLQWSGIGEPATAREHIMLDYPGFRVNARQSGTTRAANVAGVISDGTTDYASGAWAWGTLSSVLAGTVVILH